MKTNIDKVRRYLTELEYPIQYENMQEGIFIINKESEGLRNVIIGVTDTLVIVEQFLLKLPKASAEIYQQLLIKNRDMVHGAFVLDETGTKLLFRDTLQVSNLDRNELAATLNSLLLLLSEYTNQLIYFSKL